MRRSHRQIDNDCPVTARNGLPHLLVDLVQEQYVGGWGAIAKELQRIRRLPPVEYNSSSVGSTQQAKNDTEDILTALRWEKVYDFCERLHGHLARDVGYS